MKVELKLNTGRTYIANVPNNFTDKQISRLVNSELDLWNETVEEIISKEIQEPKKIELSNADMINYAKELKYSSVVNALKRRAFLDKVIDTFTNLLNKTENKYEWHDLKKNPDDLPNVNQSMREGAEYRSPLLLISTKYESLAIGQYIISSEYSIGFGNDWWVNNSYKIHSKDVEAWCHIKLPNEDVKETDQK